MHDHGDATMMKKTKPHDVNIKTSAKTVAAAMACAALLSACTLGPDYKRPSLALPVDYDASTANTTSNAPVAIPNDWWKLYNDPKLNELVEASVANNPNIKLAIARVDEARATLREANSALFPEIDYSGVGARARSGVAGGAVGGSTTAGTGGVFYGNLFRAEADISYEVDLWGKYRRGTESARASLLATSYARDVTTLALATTTAQSYFALRSLDAQIVVTENTLQAVGESLDIAQKRLNAGYSSALDYAQAETLRAQTQVALRELRRQRAVQEHQLGNLTSNLSLHVEVGSLDNLPIPASPPPGMPSTLLERRPDVQRDEQSVVATNAQIGVAKAAMFPSFGLTGAYGGQSFDLSDLLKAPFRFWNIGLGITGPIFAGGKYVARLDEAKARDSEQIATYQTTVEGAFREVADALTNVSESGAAEAEVMVQVDAARRTLRLSKLRYQSGFSAYLDVLDATRQANLAELTLVQNRASRLNYSVDLIKALGGGWADAPNASTTGSITPTSPVAAQPVASAVSSR
jgi:multidrug efflux system outer membrane protein